MNPPTTTHTRILMLILFFGCLLPLAAQTTEEKRRAYLDEIVRLQERPPSADSFVSHHDKTWIDWVKRTGELPPDFETLPSLPFLPDPLIIDEGGKNIPVRSPAQWQTQRRYIEDQVKYLFSGTFPDPPGNVIAHVLEERSEGDVDIRLVELSFGKNHQARLNLEIFTPSGEGPFPVFMTQWNHRGWAQIAVRRGYMALIYAGADTRDDTRDYLALYPEHDWTTLMARAWGAHRVVDYLYTLDNVDRSKIAITGHSRNGKQSLLAAAFDPRITAVITSSGGTAGEFPYRYTDERHPNESIEYLYSRRTHWGHPRLRFFAGREHKLPIDQTSLMALIAPNALLLSSSIREAGGGDPWALEQSYYSLASVYKFLRADEQLGVTLRDGEHAVEARDLETYMDWLDIRFGRKTLSWENKLFYNYTFDRWKQLSNESLSMENYPVSTGKVLEDVSGKSIRKTDNWLTKKRAILERMIWVSGEAPGGFRASPILAMTPREDYLESFMNRPKVRNGKKMNISPYNAMGDYLHGSLYYPTDAEGNMAQGEHGKLPVVIFLHKFSNTGFDAESNRFFESLLAKGMAVLAFDLIGYGTRIEEGTRFYERYPHWSKLGKMITDTHAAVDALETLEFVDKEKIFVSGYSLGGTVALFAAALDERVAGAAVSCAFTPWRDPGNKDQEGIRAYSHLFGLLPRLGFFEGNEDRIPVDFNEILSAIAPRPLMVIAPVLDRHANAMEVKATLEEVKSVYKLLDASKKFSYENPRAFNQFTDTQETSIVNWLEQMTKAGMQH